MFTTTMRHYVTITQDGNYHVQNLVGVHIGQHHVHTKDQFKEWSAGIDSESLLEEPEQGKCSCGLKPGESK